MTQQEELEGLLAPIESQVNSHPMISHTQHADVERERTYRLAENIDSQLKHMMQVGIQFSEAKSPNIISREV